MTVNKKQQLIEGAMRLFYQKGVHTVGINEVLKATGIAKKTLYTHFASKEELILACLQYRHDIFTAWFSELLTEKRDAKQAIINAFNGLQAWFNHEVPQLGEFRGCFFIAASAEFSATDSPINLLCRQHKDRIKAMFADCLARKYKDKRCIDSLSQQLCILKEGCISEARVRHNSRAAKQSIELIEKLMS